VTVNLLRHLSHSSLQDWSRCPLLWAGRRLFGWQETNQSDLALTIGSMMHSALSEHHRGGDGELKLLALAQRLKGQLTDMQLRGLFAALNRYQTLEEPQPKDQVAVWFETRIPEVLWPFVGEYDLLRDGDVLGEWKTGSGRWWTQAKVDTEQQATAYYYAFHATRKRMPSGMVYHSLTTTGSNPGAVVSFRTERVAADLEQFEATVQDTARQIASSALVKGCRADRCQFPSHCPNWDENALSGLSERYHAFCAARTTQDFDRSLELGEEIEGMLKEREP